MQRYIPHLILFLAFAIVFIVRAFRKYKGAAVTVPTTWVALDVKLEECEVFFYSPAKQEREWDVPSSATILSSLNEGMSKQSNQNVGMSILVFRHQFRNGEIGIFQSDPIPSDPTTVRYHLLNKSIVGKVYFDPLNPASYQFSVQFTNA